jgi:diguanylate cyclase (GGDEF)-like protein
MNDDSSLKKLDNIDSDKLFKAIEAIQEGLVIIDEKGTPEFINTAACDILQLHEIPSHSFFCQQLSFDPLSFNEQAKKEATLNGSFYHINIIPLFEKNKKTCVVLLFRDASLLKETQDIKSDFVSIASHELRTPVTAIKTSLDMLIGMCNPDVSAMQEKLLKTALRNVDRISALISHYLDITNIEKGKTSFQFKKLNLAKLVKNIVEEFNEMIKNNNTAIHVDIPLTLPYVLADQPKLEQIFFNLLENALKFTKNGIITISAIEVTSHAKGEDHLSKPMIRISVADTGPGIPEEKRKLIFDKFYRLKKTMEMGKEGVGLGLSIVKKLVEIHGGEIHVEANNPFGSRFCFTLPIYSGERRDPGFRWIFDRQFQKARENQCVMSLLAIKIRNIKIVKAQIGASKTNLILKSLEEAVKKSLYRQTDVAVKRRDQEMFVIFCDAEKEGASSICKRIKENIANVLENQFEIQPEDFGICLGFATYPNDTDNKRDLFRIALSNTLSKKNGEEENFNS